MWIKTEIADSIYISALNMITEARWVYTLRPIGCLVLIGGIV